MKLSELAAWKVPVEHVYESRILRQQLPENIRRILQNRSGFRNIPNAQIRKLLGAKASPNLVTRVLLLRGHIPRRNASLKNVVEYARRGMTLENVKMVRNFRNPDRFRKPHRSKNVSFNAAYNSISRMRNGRNGAIIPYTFQNAFQRTPLNTLINTYQAQKI